MIAAARKRWADRTATRFRVARRTTRTAEYSIANGVFNVKLDASREDWEALVAQSLRDMRAISSRGFAVNFLHPATAAFPHPPQLYGCDPSRWKAFCRNSLGARVRVIDDYGLPEYTLLVRYA